MKWYNSLITKISLVFAVAIIGIGAILFIFRTHTIEVERQNMHRYTKTLLLVALDKKNRTINYKVLEDAGFELVKDENLKKEILKKRIPPYMQKHIKRMFEHKRISLRTVEFNNNLYVIIGKNLVFKTPHERKLFPRVLLPIIAFLMILILYIAIIRSILPLYDLRKKVKEFANGNYNIDCKSNKKDEIAILANEFDRSVKKIKKLRDSRQLFLRNIMHELKTPITKGKLACEMIEESIYQQTLKNAFKRQETLIEEFARIEKLSANELELKKEKYSLQDIIDFSLDIINHNKNKVKLNITPMTLEVDFELFGTALKNLIDNGINYSNNHQVEVISTKDKIIIKNQANPLEFPLEKYAQPYFLDGKKQKSSRGLGFGLFITINLIRLHGMRLTYKHERGINIFTIHTKSTDLVSRH